MVLHLAINEFTFFSATPSARIKWTYPPPPLHSLQHSLHFLPLERTSFTTQKHLPAGSLLSIRVSLPFGI